MTSHQNRCARFAQLHAGESPFVMPNPWDAGSARVLQHVGFEALATTSAGLAYGLGRLDGTVTRDEALANARAIIEATELPVSADLENGFGSDEATVAETIRLAFGVGLSGASIEDASGDPARPIYGFDHAVARVAAAVAVARQLAFPFLVTARAEGFLHGVGDLQDIVARLRAFENVGAHVVYAPGLPDLEAVRTVVEAVRCPVNVLVTGRADWSVAQLGKLGVTRISLGGSLSRTAFGALFDAAREIRTSGTFQRVSQAMPSSAIDPIMAPKP